MNILARSWRIQLRSFYYAFLAASFAMVMAANLANASGHKATVSTDSDFAKAVQAVKDKNYQLALNLFELEAQKTEFEAMYNLALLLKAGKGRPQNYVNALYWAYLAHLGGIELAEDIIDDLTDILDETQRKPILARVEGQLLERINKGDFDAIPQYADYFISLLEEPNYEKAYQWYAIAVALNLPDMMALRDDMESKLETEKIPELQEISATLFNRLMNGEAIKIGETANES
jgi:TPR repeat protein